MSVEVEASGLLELVYVPTGSRVLVDEATALGLSGPDWAAPGVQDAQGPTGEEGGTVISRRKPASRK